MVRDHGGAAQSDQGEKEGKVLLGATKRRGGGFETRHHSAQRCSLYLSRVARSLGLGDQACQACRVGVTGVPRVLMGLGRGDGPPLLFSKQPGLERKSSARFFNDPPESGQRAHGIEARRAQPKP